jgi:hypothetical protein
MSERLIRLLAELPPAKRDPAGAQQIEMRCRAELARQAQRTSASRRAPTRHDRTVQVWQPLIAVLDSRISPT